ncbi:hypothetical protein ABIB25_000097 [Nakamurella sp. UYEF19]|uniref:hypothetical protein n=1 Tax=Nakamurella sp. UYEF19 TaxID=1756392 RepID=UPI0033976029
MNLPPHTARSVRAILVGLVGLVGVAACGSSSPAPVTSTVASSIPSATPTTTPVATAAGSAQREVNPAGDIPDNQAFVPYEPSAGKFTVTVPEGWARTDTATGVLFTDKYNSIRVDTRPATSAPTTASIRASEVPSLSGSSANFLLGDVSTVTRKAGAAIVLAYHADTPPNAVTGRVTTAAFERYVFFKAGTEVVITVGAPVGGDNVDPWRKVTDSFSWSA